jgi:hypothetical protein
MMKIRFRCQCGYEASEEARPGHALVAVYHIHTGPSSWGAHPFRMEPVSSPIVAPDLEIRELATVA